MSRSVHSVKIRWETTKGIWATEFPDDVAMIDEVHAMIGESKFEDALARIDAACVAAGASRDKSISGNIDFKENLGWLLNRNKDDRPTIMSIAGALVEEWNAIVSGGDAGGGGGGGGGGGEVGRHVSHKSSVWRRWEIVKGVLLTQYTGDEMIGPIVAASALADKDDWDAAEAALVAEVERLGMKVDKTVTAHEDFKHEFHYFVNRNRDDRPYLLSIAIGVIQQLREHGRGS